jgi:pseudaminic acid cytidylyltransferase
MNIAIIPARGGSKRIPLKNIKYFHGKPIIAYSIEAAIKSKCFDKIIVSTDDTKIAEVAKQYGAEVPFVRPLELSDDHTGTNAVVVHAINWCLDNNIKPDYVCCIYATAPFIQADNLIKGFQALQNSNKQYAFSVTSFPFPIMRALKINQDQSVSMFWPEHLNTRSQDLDDAYHDAGQFYWGKTDSFLKNTPMFSDESLAIKIPRKFTQDIDTVEDWEMAEMQFKVSMPEE